MNSVNLGAGTIAYEFTEFSEDLDSLYTKQQKCFKVTVALNDA